MSRGVARIDDHGLVGDLRTTALISNTGAVDSLCLPDLDSPSVFAALLDGENGGHLSIDLLDIPDGEDIRSRQHYLPNTNILMTRMQGAGAITQVRDFMLPVHLADGRVGVLVRQITALHGSRSVHLACWPGFDYARAEHRATLSDDARTVDFTSDAGCLRLHSSHEIALQHRDRGPEATVQVTLEPDEVATLVLEWVQQDEPAGPAQHTIEQVDGWAHATEHYWHSWIDSTSYHGGWADPVRRSALCLKLLQHQPTGGIVAAPTFGLPEWPGADRNWDYRYVWLRDAAFVIFAFLRIGFVDEATQFTDWLTRRCVDIDDGNGLHPVYRLDGTPPDDEIELTHLAGHVDSRPVRIGNAAYDQVQLDVLGEVMDGLYLFDRVRPISWDLWLALGVQLDWLTEHWEQPDSGIWEIRGEAQQFVSSKLLVWVAFERAVRLARRRGLPGDRDKWQSTADAAYRWVQEHGWDADRGVYVQRAGAQDLDASALLIPMLRFASGTDPRVLATLDAIGDELATDSMLNRYRVPGGSDPSSSDSDCDSDSDSDSDDSVDGVGGAEGTFTVCTFWYVENLARAGRLHEARLTFEKVLTYANELGLFSEQIGPAGEALGNFPQALTHLGLISAATTLDQALRTGGRT